MRFRYLSNWTLGPKDSRLMGAWTNRWINEWTGERLKAFADAFGRLDK